MTRIAVIGAGIAGLTLAQELAPLAEVEVFEKSRGYGGRMATRSVEPYQFDHGAQFFTARSEAFKAFLQTHIERGHVARWDASFVEIDAGRIVSQRCWAEGPAHYVAAPRMNSLAKQMALDLDVRLATRVDQVVANADGWQLLDQQQAVQGVYDWVVVAVPAVQAACLLPESSQLRQPLEQKQMLGCYSLMLGFRQAIALDWQAAFVSGADISWISNDSSKPGRPESYSLLVHSTNLWAERNIDAEAEWVTAYLCEELARVINLDISQVDHVALHRWLYANIGKQQGEEFFIDCDSRLAAAGDWCIHGRIESAYLSALRLAQRLKLEL